MRPLRKERVRSSGTSDQNVSINSPLGSLKPCIEGSHLTSQVQGSQHAAMLGGKLSVAGGLGTLTHMFVLGNFAQL